MMLRLFLTMSSKKRSVSSCIDASSAGSAFVTSCRPRISSHCPMKSLVREIAFGSLSMRAMCDSRLARSVPAFAALNSSSSGIVLQRKYERRLASWYSVISNTLPVPSGFGSRSTRNRNSGDIIAARAARPVA